MEFIRHVSEDVNAYDLMYGKINDEDIFIKSTNFTVSYYRKGGFFYNEIYSLILNQLRIDWNESFRTKETNFTEEELMEMDDRTIPQIPLQRHFTGFSYNSRTKTVNYEDES